MKICSVEGCERKYYAKGLCNYHYEQLRKTNNCSKCGVKIYDISTYCHRCAALGKKHSEETKLRMSITHLNGKTKEMSIEEMKEYQKQWRKDNPKKMREYQKKWKKNNPEKIKRYQSGYQKEWRKNNSEKTREASKIWKINNKNLYKPNNHSRKIKRKSYYKYPDKNIARAKLYYGIKMGRITPEPCEICGVKKTHGHHESYLPEYWLIVVWLCNKCHGKINRIYKTKHDKIIQQKVTKLFNQRVVLND